MFNLWFQKNYAKPSPWMVTGNSKGKGGRKDQFFKGNYEPKLQFSGGGGGGVQTN